MDRGVATQLKVEMLSRVRRVYLTETEGHSRRQDHICVLSVPDRKSLRGR